MAKERSAKKKTSSLGKGKQAEEISGRGGREKGEEIGPKKRRRSTSYDLFMRETTTTNEILWKKNLTREIKARVLFTELPGQEERLTPEIRRRHGLNELDEISYQAFGKKRRDLFLAGARGVTERATARGKQASRRRDLGELCSSSLRTEQQTLEFPIS